MISILNNAEVFSILIYFVVNSIFSIVLGFEKMCLSKFNESAHPLTDEIFVSTQSKPTAKRTGFYNNTCGAAFEMSQSRFLGCGTAGAKKMSVLLTKRNAAFATNRNWALPAP